MPSLLTSVLCCIFIAAFTVNVEALSWRSSKEKLPAEAVFAGYDNHQRALFVARVNINGVYHLGYARQDAAFAGNLGKEYEVKEWEYLSMHCYHWEEGYAGDVPNHAIYDFTASTKFYVGRQFYETSLLSGKVLPHKQKFYTSYQGKEISLDTYQVLVSCENIF